MNRKPRTKPRARQPNRLNQARADIEAALELHCRTELEQLGALADVAMRLGFTAHFRRDNDRTIVPMDLSQALAMAEAVQKIGPETPAHDALVTLAHFFAPPLPKLTAPAAPRPSSLHRKHPPRKSPRRKARG